MKIITLDNRIIYKADEGKRVKFVGETKLYREISVDKEDERKVEEVAE